MGTAEMLYNSGAKIDAVNMQDESMLHLACGSPDSRCEPALISFLTKNGLPFNAADGSGRTPLIRAAGAGNAAYITALLETGADKDMCDQQGRSALHHAASGNHIDSLALLLQAGFDMDAKDQEG